MTHHPCFSFSATVAPRLLLPGVVVLVLTIAAGFTVSGTAHAEPPADHDQMRHISSQAREFIANNSPKALEGPLTPALAARMREKQHEASAQGLENLRQSMGVGVEKRSMAGVDIVLLQPSAPLPQKDAIAIYIHGGGYALKSPLDSTAVMMAHALDMPVCSIGYRLAPEHPFPAGLQDCLAAYRGLLKEHPDRPMVLFAGSAGGGLALAMLQRARDEGLPLPLALGLVSPWSDLSRTGDSYYANEGRDPILSWEDNLEYFAAAYAPGRDPRNPLLSPVHANYTGGFPPTLIITGTRDLFLSNCVRLAQAMRKAGVDVDLLVWEEMFHGFDLMPDLPEGREARQELAAFLLEALPQ